MMKTAFLVAFTANVLFIVSIQGNLNFGSSSSSSSASSSSSTSSSYTSSSSSSSSSSTESNYNNNGKKCRRPNEIYDLCPATCPFRTCGIDDNLIDCRPSPSVGDPDCPPPACRCANGYFRDDKGNCVEQDKCPKCNNPNEEYDACPELCPPRRCDVDDSLILCEVPPQLGDPKCEPGCRCSDNYARNDKGICIPREQCPKKPTCTENEVFSNCSQIICRAQYCSQKGLPIPCASVSSKYCIKECVCAPNYLRNSNGVCVPEDQCDEPVCSENEEFSNCTEAVCRAQHCYQKNKQVACAGIAEGSCTAGCVCAPNYLRSYSDGACIPEDQCGEPTCEENEVLSDCTQATCRPENCYQKGQSVPCAAVSEGSCITGCVCAQNYLRNSNGVCVPEDQCDVPTCPENEVRLNCTKVIDRPEYCFQKGKTIRHELNADESCFIGCVCAENYLRNSDGVCVPEDQCDNEPKCTDNEIFSNCTQAICRPKYCPQKGTSVPCVAVAEDSCYSGCVCAPNYLRNSNGVCVLEDQCDEQTCGENEIYSNCTQAICRPEDCSQKDKSVPCAGVAEGSCIKGCVCAPNYLRHSNGVCVPEDKCDAPTCSENEVFTTCTQAVCRAEYCYQKDKPVPCAGIAEGSCITGCVCAPDYLRNSNGVCVPEDQCEAATCAENEVFTTCTQAVCRAEYCYQKDKPVPCAGIAEGSCITGCVCAPDYLRNSNGVCVPEDQCEAATCAENEVFTTCTQAVCRAEYCYQKDKPVPCAGIAEGSCITGCVCAPDYLRNSNGVCVPEDQCEAATCTENEVFSNCTQAVCRAEYCTQKGKPVPCAGIAEGSCITGCVCAPNYLRNSNGVCVPEDQCEGGCKENERFVECPDAECVAQACTDVGFPIRCPRFAAGKCPSKPGCICNSGYYRNSKGICVPGDQCPSCGGDPNSRPGCGNNCGRLCSNYGNPGGVACTLSCNLNGCDCIKGYVLDSNTNKCVLPKECTPQCGKDEIYSTCANGGCDKRLCSQLNKPQICIDPIKCEGGCVCREGYLRDSNGVCVPQDQCGTIQCNRPNEFFACGSECDNDCATLDKQNRTNCPIVNIQCNKKCYCKDGYARDENKNCVPIHKCKTAPRCSTNEVLSNCIEGVCRIQDCTQKGQDISCIAVVPPVCTKGCICAKNYLRNANGTCIPEDKCEECPKGETYSNCPPVYRKDCDSEYCPRTRNDPATCPTTRQCGKPKCVCGYLDKRNRETGKCVRTSDCPPFPCDGPNEEYQSCPPGCPGENCTDYLENTKCPKFKIDLVVPCKPQCRCLKGFYRNAKGICIKSSKCKDKKKL